jgi:hypothetical protein
MVFADDIRRVILELAEKRGTGHTFASDEVARAVDEKNWHVISEQVKLVAGILVQEGKIVATQAGKVVDVDQSKGPLAFRKL